MAESDVIQIGDTDSIKVRYSELEEDTLFWLQTRSDDFNSPMRKIDESSALHLREQRVVEMQPSQFVYEKE